jgi:hypothetical protein
MLLPPAAQVTTSASQSISAVLWFRIIRRRDQTGWGEYLLHLSKSRCPAAIVDKLLFPHPPQKKYRWQACKLGPSTGGLHTLQESPSIQTNRHRQLYSLSVRLGKSEVFDASSITRKPLRISNRLQPLRSLHGKAVECCPQCLAHTLQAIHRADCCKSTLLSGAVRTLRNAPPIGTSNSQDR